MVEDIDLYYSSIIICAQVLKPWPFVFQIPIVNYIMVK